MKRLLSLLLISMLLITLASCGKDTTAPGGGSGGSVNKKPAHPEKIVGICVPNEEDPRWSAETEVLSQLLEQAGLTAMVEYAQNDVSLQISQLQAMIAQPVGCLVIAAIDSLALTDVLQQAKQASIPVIAYDRLLMQTDAVTAYVGYDYQRMGADIAEHIVNTKKLETAQAESRSHTIEFFMGSPEDNNAVALYTGLLQVLQPYLDSGVLVCHTGRTAFEDVCIQDWSAEQARSACKNAFSSYPETVPEILCCASNSIADGCRMALEQAGVALGDTWPVITGQGDDLAALRRLQAGQQSMTAYKDLSDLPENCAKAVKSALKLTSADPGNGTCDNGMVSVVAFFSRYFPADNQNYREVLIVGGIVSEQELTETTQ